MLEDKDRIFTNVYGYQPWNLNAAMARGDWDNTKALLDRGPDKLVEEIMDSELRGRGGAGFRPVSNGRSCPRSRPKPGRTSW